MGSSREAPRHWRMAEKKKRTRARKADTSKAPQTPQERDELLAFISDEIRLPTNIVSEIDFANPNALDSDIAEAIKAKKVPQDRVGRPTKMIVPTLQKLKIAFLVGSTDVEAADFAGIGESTLYDFQKKYPEFSELKRKWKNTDIMASRLNMLRSIVMNKSIEDSRWTLRAKRSEEYGEKSKLTVDDARRVSIEELEEASRNGVISYDA